jgi:hypothetical protein
MSKNDANHHSSHSLSWQKRCTLLLLGIIFFGMHIGNLPSPGRTELITAGEASLALLFAAAGIVVFIVAAMGVLPNRIGAGGSRGFQMEFDQQRIRNELAEKQMSNEPVPEGPMADLEEAPEAVGPSVTEATDKDGKRVAVFKLEEVPTQVLCDLISKWDEKELGPKPYDFRAFDYATRGIGKGNHAWWIKLKGRGAFWVGYGRGVRVSRAST